MRSPGTSASPRAVVRVNGYDLKWLQWEVNNNNFYQADTFTAVFPLSSQPQGVDPSWWYLQRQLDVEICEVKPTASAGVYSPSDLITRISGKADSVEIDPVARVVMVTGRDYTSLLIDTITDIPNFNKTASAVAIAYANDHGLIPKVTATNTKVGNYYKLEHVDTKPLRTKWDILTHLAHEEQFDVYVMGKELHFEPKVGADSAELIEFDESGSCPQFPGVSLKFHRDLSLARGIIVHVRSWNLKQTKGFTESARTKKVKDPVLRKAGHLLGEEQVFSFVVPNLTRAEAKKLAMAKLAAISQHMVKMTASFPPDPTRSPRVPIRLKWTAAQLDQIYYIDSIIRKVSITDYHMDVSAKNSDVESVVSL